MTFPSPAIRSITTIPLNADETAGRFRVWLTVESEPQPVLVWDRKVEGGFPELKVLVRVSDSCSLCLHVADRNVPCAETTDTG